MTRKEWLVAAILTFVTLCAWGIFNILHTRSQVTISDKVQQLIEPINPEFDTSDVRSTP